MSDNRSKRLQLFKFKIKTERNRFLIKKVSAKTKEEVQAEINEYSGNVKTVYIRSAAPLKDQIDHKVAAAMGNDTPEKVKKEILLRAKKVKPIEVARFLERFAEATDASIKPLDIINSLLQEDFTYNMKMLFIELQFEMNKGNALYMALELIPGISKEAIAIIRIGEESGKVPATLMQIAKDIRLKVEIKKKLKKGLTKPIFTLLFAFAIVIFIVPTMVNPIKDMFAQFGNAQLPLLTRVVIAVTDMITNYAPFIGGGGVILGVLIALAYKRYYGFRLKVDQSILNMPIIGQFIRDISTLKILVGINMYVQSAVPLAEALNKIIETVKNVELKEEMIYISKEVDKGKYFSDALSQSIYFNDYIKGEIAVAEREGSLVKKLNLIIEILDKKIEEDSEAMISSLTKSIGLFVTLVVGVVIIAVYSPMFALMGEVNKSIMEN